MYAHRIIESFQNSREPGNDSSLLDFELKALPLNISRTQKFHMGEYDELSEPFKHLINEKLLFYDYSEYSKFPYKKCWFDFNHLESTAKNINKLHKHGILCRNVAPDLFHTLHFSYAHDYKTWGLSPVSCLFSVGKKLGETNLKNFLVSPYNQWEPLKAMIQHMKAMSNLIAIPLRGHLMLESQISLLNDIRNDLQALQFFLLLLNCKNITTEKVEAPAKLNKKRKQHGKVELFSYHTLKLKLPSVKTSHGTQEIVYSHHNRVHFCRGHFKEYTKEKPLFGKLTGLYWWESHMRGRNTDGFVGKEYEIEKSKE